MKKTIGEFNSTETFHNLFIDDDSNISQLKQIENEIRKEVQLSGSIINSLPGIFYLYDETGKFIRWNKNFETVSGYSSEEVSKMNPLDFFDEDEKELLQTKIMKVLEVGVAEVEAYFFTKNKEKIPYYFNGKLVTFGEKKYVVGMGIDITLLKKRDEEIAKSEKRFRYTLDSMLEGVQIFDSNWCGLYENEVASRQGFYSKKDTEGKTLLENYPGIEETELFKIFNKCREEGIPKHIEYPFTFQDGSSKWFELSIQPNPEGLFILSVDIDEKKKARETIKASEENYRYLFDNNPALIILWDLETLKILEVNEKVFELYGYTKEEYKTMDILQYRPVEDHEKIKKFAKRMLNNEAGESKSRGIWRHFKKNGDILYMDITSLLMDYKGRKAILALAKDITEQYKAEEELKKSHEDIRRLNTHLHTIREEERMDIAREIHDELGQQLTGLKMDASWLRKKIENGDITLYERLTEMIGLIDTTIKTVRKISSDLRPGILDDLGLVAALEWQSSEFEKRSGIPCIFDTELTELNIDNAVAIAIFRVYQESLTNVMRHAKATEVNTNLKKVSNNLVLTIKDNGEGFDPDKIKNKKTLGLIGMQERSIMLGGKLDINVANGTAIILTIPIY